MKKMVQPILFLCKEGNELKKSNPEFVEIELNNMANLNFECIHSAIKVRKLAIEIILPLINDRFSSLLNPIFESMDWLDPQVWTADSMYGDASISLLLNEFFYPLEKLGMDFEHSPYPNICVCVCVWLQQ